MDYYRLFKQIEDHEGFRASVYPDSEGFWTIGIGRMVDARRGGGITREEALDLLENDIRKVTQQLNEHLPWWNQEDDVRQRVMADLCFNLGISGLVQFRATLAAWKAHDFQQAARHLEDSKWYKQVGRRGPRLVKMLETGEDV